MKALGFAIAIALGATAAAGQDRPTNDQLIGYFETVVFGNEVPGREATIIRKWDGVIRYKFGGITAVVERSRGGGRGPHGDPDAFFEFAIRGDCGGRPWRADDNLVYGHGPDGGGGAGVGCGTDRSCGNRGRPMLFS